MEFELLTQIIIITVSTILTSIVAFLCKEIRSKNKESSENENALKAGILALCRDRILQGYRYYRSKGGISAQDLETMNKLYSAYHKLGGNGTITTIYSKIQELPLKEGGKT